MHFPFENVPVVWHFAPKDGVRWMLQNTANEMTQNRSRWRAETVGDGTPTLSGCRDPLDLRTMGNHRGRRRRLRPREPLTSPRAVGEPPRHRPAPPSRRITAFLPRLPNGRDGAAKSRVFHTVLSEGSGVTGFRCRQGPRRGRGRRPGARGPGPRDPAAAPAQLRPSARGSGASARLGSHGPWPGSLVSGF